MSVRRIIITGGSSGIGKAAASLLADQRSEIIITGSGEEKGLRAESELRELTGCDRIFFRRCDLSSLGETNDFAQFVYERWDSLDLLINNAGALSARKKITGDGFEYTFQVNYLSHFLLTIRLLRLLQRGEGRIVNVTSRMERYGRINLQDVDYRKGYTAFSAYANSKLAQLMFTYMLAEKMKDGPVTVNAAHPGGVATGLYDFSGVVSAIAKLGKRLMDTPERGADTVVYLANAPKDEALTGRYFIKRKAVVSSKQSYDKEKQKQLWEKSLQWTGLDDVF